jgi:O-antigen ligase
MTPPSKKLERTVMSGVLLLLFWLPLPVGSNRDWSTGLLLLACAVLGIGWAVNALRRNRDTSPTLKAGLPMLGLLLVSQAWVAVQWLGGMTVDSAATFGQLLLGLAYSMLFLVTVDLFRTRRRLSLLLGTLVLSGTFQAFFGSVMTLSGVEWLLAGPKTAYFGDATGTFVNRNHFAGYLEIAVACGIGLLLALRDERPFRWLHVLETLLGPKARLRLALILMMIALVMSHSRMGNVALFTSILVVGGLFLLANREHRLRNALILASLLLIDVLIVSQYFGLEKLVDRISTTQLEDRVVNGETLKKANELRVNVFAAALPLAREHWLTGQGAGTFEVVLPQVAGADIPYHFDHAHNDYLEFIIEYGVLGSLPLALFVLLALYHAQRAMWQRESLYRSGMGLGVSIGLLSLLIHSASDFNLQIPANAATYVVLCAIAVLSNEHYRERRTQPRESLS